MRKNKIKLNEVKQVTSVKEMLELAAKEDGDKIAFEYKEGNEKIKKITYSEFVKDTEELGTALASIGMHDKHIAIIGENLSLFGLGILISFLTGLICISFLLKYIRKNDFKLFMIYRILLGIIVLILGI